MKDSKLLQAFTRWKRHWLLFFADAVVLFISIYAAMLMRFAPNLPEGVFHTITAKMPYLILSYLGTFLLFRMYQVLWRYADTHQLALLALSNIVGCGVTFLWNLILDYKLSLYYLIILCALSIAGTCGVRLALRIVGEYYANHRQKNDQLIEGHRLLIVGGGKSCSTILEHRVQFLGNIGFPVGIADDDQSKHGMTIGGISVLGSVKDIPRIVRDKNITDIVIALPSVRGARLQEIITICNGTHCHVRMLTVMSNASADESKRLIVREPDLLDFLSCSDSTYDNDELSKAFEGKTVMITGGAGSLGTEIAHQLMKFSPRGVVIFDNNESNILEMRTSFLDEFGSGCPLYFAPGSVCDKARLNAVAFRYNPDIIIHAASSGNVPLMEEEPGEAVKCNIFGTINALEVAVRSQCECFVYVSSNKAVNPSCVVGATKRASELISMLYAQRSNTRIMCVRLGNLMGSRSSVVPLFVRQIHAGRPLTLTHPDAERYFTFTLKAAQLILRVCANGETGNIYLPDASEPTKIRDLAEKLIRFYGFEPNEDIQIRTVGLRAGEKMTEEMISEEERAVISPSSFEDALVIPSVEMDEACINKALEELSTLPDAPDSDARIIALLKTLVPTYGTDNPL